jgi:hypothetical protein
MPRSMAESTFSLRSFEYAFMDLFLCRSAIYATRCKKLNFAFHDLCELSRDGVLRSSA